MFAPGTAELVVGESVLREFDGFELGQSIRLGNNDWIIVGVFSTGGSVFDSKSGPISASSRTSMTADPASRPFAPA